MTNSEVVASFLEILLQSPDLTMQAIHVRLAHTDYELRLLKADPHKRLREEANKAQLRFPINTGEKSYESQCY